MQGVRFLQDLKDSRGEIVTFGDSLTHGMVVTTDHNSWWRDNHPFSIKLAQLMNVTVTEKGFNGMQAKEMMSHLETILKVASVAKRDIRLVTILGGTNDLGARAPEAEISKHLESLHKYALSTSDKLATVALTIPDLSWREVNHSVRLKVNENLRAFAARNHRVILVDLEKRFNLKDTGSKGLFSIDTVHLSPLGYDTVATMIFEALTEYE